MMRIEVLEPEFTVCKVTDYSGVDLEGEFVFTGSTDVERSLVCPTTAVPDNTVSREDGWRAFRIVGQLDFSLVGVLSSVTSALAAEGIPVFAVSTFDTDYVLVRSRDLSDAADALRGSGFEVGDTEMRSEGGPHRL